MPPQHSVAVFIGSLRRDSLTRKVTQAAIALAPASLCPEIVDIGQLPLYNHDLEDAPPIPAEWLAFRDRVRPFDAVLFATPEYNRSVPGVLKNALDVGSRPSGKSVWNDKPGAVISVTNGLLGAFGANHHLRQSLTYLNVPTMQQPEAYIPRAAQLFDPAGNLVKDDTREFLRTFMTSFAKWIERLKVAPASGG